MAKRLELLALSLLTLACADRAPTDIGDQPQPKVEATEPSGAADRGAALVARSLAMAMQVPETRLAIRDVLRRSPLTSHKVVWRRFLQEEAGRLVLARMAEAAATSERELRAAIAALPELDFYVPAREHRLTWRGSDDVLVAVILGEHNPSVVAYRPSGDAVTLRREDGLPRQTVFLLQASETKSRRIGRQADRPGDVIQELDDGELSGSVTIVTTAGDTVVREFADIANAGPSFAQVCPEDACGGTGGGGGGGGGGTGGGTSGTIGTTYLDRVVTQGVCDNAACWLGDTNEFEWDGEWNYGALHETHTVRVENVPTTGERNNLRALGYYLIQRIPASGISVKIRAIRETDTLGDDTWLYGHDIDFNDNGITWAYTENFGDSPPLLRARLFAKFVW